MSARIAPVEMALTRSKSKLINGAKTNKTKTKTKGLEKGRKKAKSTAIDGAEKLVGSEQRLPKAIGKTKTGGRGGRRSKIVPDVAIGARRPKRQQADDTVDSSEQPDRKRKRSNDRIFLEQARDQLKGFKRKDVKQISRFLDDLEPPSGQRTLRRYRSGDELDTESIDAYELSASDARALLASAESIRAPVFVVHGANTVGILWSDSERRPIDQVLDWFPNPLEEVHGRAGASDKSASINEIRTRFATNGPVNDRKPWNMPDMPYPFHHSGVPTFLQQPACNLLGEVIRVLLNLGNIYICKDSCKNAKTDDKCCAKHFVTTEEHAEITRGWRQWHGTVMMAEAGGLTTPHVDSWAFGTWISCLEGEIGFGWLPHASSEDRQAVFDETIKPDGRWRYKVLRANDTLYMGPQTPHLVFRLPEGRQTLALAGHIVRRVDAELWVHSLALDLAKSDANAVGDCVRGLAAGLQYVHDNVMTRPKAYTMYGGKQQVARVKQALLHVEEKTKQR
ncbi:hypothetical protein LTR56_013997 [Elasticomyces elasticus]|nr:hypothetical protein LTR56_013997 [Elasticomyces elasticus]KAK3652018.1 hypothetical protein LTR22_011807 [Elasticomyces elasticus]KAK4912396.1 hypothetical protein LTR49_019113 [Elasticomyces elasticus]KAK5751637.1 hypothetical protein LTS12_018249 [Elasticomyces elasticus]